MRGHWNRRSFLLGGGAFMGALSAGGCGTAASGTTRLRASITGKGESDIRLLLRTAGLGTSGFEVVYSDFPSGQQVVEALNAGALDYGSMSEIPPIFAASSAPRFRQIAVTHGDVNNQVVLVPKGSSARSIADLKGRRVGYVRATTSQYFLLQMLAQEGLGWSDIQPVALGVSDGAAAFSQGALDGWAIYGFPIQRAIANQDARILKTALGILSGNYPICAHVDALADPAMVARIGDYLRLVRQGHAWSAAHSDVWAAVIAGNIGVPLADVQDQFRRRSAGYSLRPIDAAAIASQQAVADVFARQKLIPAAVDVRPLWDDRFNGILQEKV